MNQPARSVVLHGHFYQPPRENPWTGRIPEQPSAAPFHDWNERIESECYGPVVASRVLGDGGEPDQVVNCLEWMSFNFGPTLLVWMEQHAPETYAAILEADRISCERLDGHGNAIAMAYHHPILPLSSPRDRRTEIRWGIADFRRRFGREPEGMWLPETAVDDATLDALAQEGIRFTILAPHQVETVPADGRPGLYRTAGGREIALFLYDGALSHGVAFGDVLDDGVAWGREMAGVGDGRGGAGEGVDAGAEVGEGDMPPRSVLRSLATDGETFGHHHKFGEMALARALLELRAHSDVRLENFAAYLARVGATERVTLVEPSAWSCAHGVERWRADCGCKADTGRGWNQEWRAPLREALEWLAGELHEVFEREGRRCFDDPWAARDAYGERLEAGATRGPDEEARRLLEMERDALRFFTSCAWFFDDIGGLEPQQILAYSAHALELAGEDGARLRPRFLERLEEARSNDPAVGTAADVFGRVVKARASRPPADGE